MGASKGRIFFFFLHSSTTTFLAVKDWLKGFNVLVQHHPTLSTLTCCTRLATMLHQTSSSTSSNVSFVLRSEQQCGITFNIFACALVLRLSVSMVMVYSCICFARFHVSSSFRTVNEPSLEHAISLRTDSPSCVHSSQGHDANESAGSFASQGPGKLLPTQ